MTVFELLFYFQIKIKVDAAGEGGKGDPINMGTSQKYSLRWNDFSLNVATTFRDLHSQQVSLLVKVEPELDSRKL